MKWRRLNVIGEASTPPYAGSPGAFRTNLTGPAVPLVDGCRGKRVASWGGRAQEEGSTVTLADLMVLEEHPGITRRTLRPVTTGLYHVALLVPNRRELGRSLLGLRQAAIRCGGCQTTR